MVNGDAAEQVVKMTLEGTEVALRVTGSLAKNVLVAIYALLSDHEKTAGQVRMKELLKSGKELKLYTIRADELQKFKEVAKQYGVLYTVMRDKENTDPHAELDLFARMEDAPKINRIVEKYGFGTVLEVAEITRAEELETAAPEATEAAAKDAIVDELLDGMEEEPPAQTAPEAADKDAAADELVNSMEDAPTERPAGTDGVLDELMGVEDRDDPFASQKSDGGSPSVSSSEASIERPSVQKQLDDIRRDMGEKQENSTVGEKVADAMEKVSTKIKEDIQK